MTLTSRIFAMPTIRKMRIFRAMPLNPTAEERAWSVIAGLVYLQLALRFRYDVVRAAGIVQEDAVAKHLDHSQPSLNVKLTVPPPVIVSCTVVSPSGRMKAGIVCVPCRSEYVIPPVTIWQASDAVIVGHTGMRPLFVIVFVADDTDDDTHVFMPPCRK